MIKLILKQNMKMQKCMVWKRMRKDMNQLNQDIELMTPTMISTNHSEFFYILLHSYSFMINLLRGGHQLQSTIWPISTPDCKHCSKSTKLFFKIVIFQSYQSRHQQDCTSTVVGQGYMSGQNRNICQGRTGIYVGVGEGYMSGQDRDICRGRTGIYVRVGQEYMSGQDRNICRGRAGIYVRIGQEYMSGQDKNICQGRTGIFIE